MEKINQNKLEGIKDLIKKVYEGNDNYRNKISVLMNTRRKNHNNKEIQDLCNFYLTKLYDEKFNDLKNKNKIDESLNPNDQRENDIQTLVSNLWSKYSNTSRKRIYTLVANAIKDFPEFELTDRDFYDLLDASIANGSFEDYLDLGDKKILDNLIKEVLDESVKNDVLKIPTKYENIFKKYAKELGYSYNDILDIVYDYYQLSNDLSDAIIKTHHKLSKESLDRLNDSNIVEDVDDDEYWLEWVEIRPSGAELKGGHLAPFKTIEMAEKKAKEDLRKSNGSKKDFVIYTLSGNGTHEIVKKISDEDIDESKKIIEEEVMDKTIEDKFNYIKNYPTYYEGPTRYFTRPCKVWDLGLTPEQEDTFFKFLNDNDGLGNFWIDNADLSDNIYQAGRMGGHLILDDENAMPNDWTEFDSFEDVIQAERDEYRYYSDEPLEDWEEEEARKTAEDKVNITYNVLTSFDNRVDQLIDRLKLELDGYVDPNEDIEEDLNKKKRKNLYVNPDAGNVEHNVNFFNQCTDVGNVADAGQALGEKKERINIKESLIKLDNEDYKGYYDMYINANLDLNQKQELANLLADNKINESYNYLLKRQK